MNQSNQNLNPVKEFFVDFSKASPEAVERILDALNAEVDAAVANKRIPTLEGAYRRLGTATSVMN